MLKQYVALYKIVCQSRLIKFLKVIKIIKCSHGETVGIYGCSSYHGESRIYVKNKTKEGNYILARRKNY